MGDGEKLLTYLTSALKALLGFDIFPRVPKKSEILLPSVISGPSYSSLSDTSLSQMLPFDTVMSLTAPCFICVHMDIRNVTFTVKEKSILIFLPVFFPGHDNGCW